MRFGVLLQMIPPAKFLATGLTSVRPNSGVDPFVPGQFLVPGEGLPATGIVTLEGAFSCGIVEENERSVRISSTRLKVKIKVL